jgi:hypothetical protein
MPLHAKRLANDAANATSCHNALLGEKRDCVVSDAPDCDHHDHCLIEQ